MTRRHAVQACVLALAVAASAAATAGQPESERGHEIQQTFFENLWIETVGPSIDFNKVGGPPGTNSRMAISNNGYGFFVTEPGPEGILLNLQNSNVSSSTRRAFMKAPLVVGPSWVLSPHGSLSVYGQDDARLYVEDYSTTVVGRNLLRLRNRGPATFRFENADSGAVWAFGSIVADDKFFISKGGAAGLDLTLDGAGNLTILGTLTQLSDRNAKRDVEAIDERALLDKLSALPVSTWSYKQDERGARHIGPMAQDFAATFGLGHDETHVAPSDVAGVSLAAVQALKRRHEAQIAELQERLARLEAALASR